MIFDTDLRFGDWERGLLDVMTPDGEGPFPVVVCVHGGGWRFGVKDDMHPYAEWLLPLGIASVLPNYRLSDEAIHPAQQDDVIAALNWIANNANEYHFDVDRTGLTGVSAGGHLSAQVGCLAKERAPRVRVRCMYPVCPADGFPPVRRGQSRNRRNDRAVPRCESRGSFRSTQRRVARNTRSSRRTSMSMRPR